MPTLLKMASSLKTVPINKDSVIFLEEERKKASNSIKTYDWSGYETAIILSTSGTTGIPKRAELSSNAINALAYQGGYVDLDLKPGRSILTPAPPFLAFGISLTIHMPLCNGVCLILSPSPDPDFVVKQFIKNKPNLFMGGHIFLDKLMNNKKLQKMDLSFVKAIEIGGEAVALDYLCEVNAFLKEHNSLGGAYVGYGMTELSGCSTTESKSARRSGSVGIPLCDVNVKSVDIESKKEVPYDSEGEIYISSPCMMNGYFNNQEVTSEMIEIDENGIRWIRTGDLGKIDSDGFVYIIGRIKRIEVTVDPETNAQVKLYPDYIEYFLNSINSVERSAVVVVDSPERMRVPVAFVKMREGCKEDIDEFDEFFSANTEAYNKPVEYRFVYDLPVLPNGKIDYQTLLKELNKTRI